MAITSPFLNRSERDFYTMQKNTSRTNDYCAVAHLRHKNDKFSILVISDSRIHELMELQLVYSYNHFVHLQILCKISRNFLIGAKLGKVNLTGPAIKPLMLPSQQRNLEIYESNKVCVQLQLI